MPTFLEENTPWGQFDLESPTADAFGPIPPHPDSTGSATTTAHTSATAADLAGKKEFKSRAPEPSDTAADVAKTQPQQQHQHQQHQEQQQQQHRVGQQRSFHQHTTFQSQPQPMQLVQTANGTMILQPSVYLAPAPVVQLGSARRHPYRRCSVSCVNCRKAKAKCEDVRPCPRCVRLGRESTCVDGETVHGRKRSARSYQPQATQPTQPAAAVAPAATVIPSSMAAPQYMAGIQQASNPMMMDDGHAYIRVPRNFLQHQTTQMLLSQLGHVTVQPQHMPTVNAGYATNRQPMTLQPTIGNPQISVRKPMTLYNMTTGGSLATMTPNGHINYR